MGFELGKLKRPLVEVEYKPYDGIADGEGLKLSLNLDLLTLEKMEEIEADFEQQLAEVKNNAGDEGSEAEVQVFYFDKMSIRCRAQMLGGRQGENNPDARIIRSWNMIEGKKNVPVCFETFVKMEKTVLDALYEFVTGDAQKVTKKK